jgi:hypothetical protein
MQQNITWARGRKRKQQNIFEKSHRTLKLSSLEIKSQHGKERSDPM